MPRLDIAVPFYDTVDLGIGYVPGCICALANCRLRVQPIAGELALKAVAAFLGHFERTAIAGLAYIYLVWRDTSFGDYRVRKEKSRQLVFQQLKKKSTFA